MTFYVLSVLLCLTTIYVWWHGTAGNNWAVSSEEVAVFSMTCFCTIVPVVNFLAGLFLLWHILKRVGRV